jgi:hypothetical protein
MPFASQIMSKGICRDQAVLRFGGCPANWFPFSGKLIHWIDF